MTLMSVKLPLTLVTDNNSLLSHALTSFLDIEIKILKQLV